MIAVCDVQQAVRERQKAIVDAKYGDNACSMYNDFRELLARPDLDAVVIAVPEHWHPLIGIEAARRGKHMYYEKPLSLTLEQGKAVREAVERAGVAFQFGTQQRSGRDYRFACELVRNGRIGQLQTIAVGSPGAPPKQLPPEGTDPVPPGFDWNMWLGPAPWTEYSELRVSALWMHIYDYGLGSIDGAYGIHDVDIAQWMNNADSTGPLHESCDGNAEVPTVPERPWTGGGRDRNGRMDLREPAGSGDASGFAHEIGDRTE
ncbi:MAG: Gfo/Idh/MocA family oxidoreductase [Acidobacteria bacterium]|nr:Gfo/Idh/MocA family oxidoreductase [Acidobacteriota bacterium]